MKSERTGRNAPSVPKRKTMLYIGQIFNHNIMKRKTHRHVQSKMVDDTIHQLLYEICHTTDKEKVAECFKLAIEYATDSEKNKTIRKNKPMDRVVIGLDSDDYKEVLDLYPESKWLYIVSLDMPHLYKSIMSSGATFGKTHLLIADLKINPSFPFMTREIDYLEKITELFCDGERNVKWGLVKTNSVAKIGIDIVYQEI